MALDLSLFNRARASVSSDTDSGYFESRSETLCSDVTSVRSANVSPVPKLYGYSVAVDFAAHSAPVSPSSTKGRTITVSPPPQLSSSTHLAPPSRRTHRHSPSRLSNSISSLATSCERMDMSHASTSVDMVPSFCHDMKLNLKRQPSKLIPEKMEEKKAHKFNIDSLLADPKHKCGGKKRGNQIPPPLQLSSSSVFHTPASLSPYDIRSHRFRMSNSEIPSPHTPQRFNFDLMNIRADMPAHSPVSISPYNPSESGRIFNFIGTSLPTSPLLTRAPLPVSPFIPVSPLLTPGHGWSCPPPRQRMDSSSLEHESPLTLPFQTYTTIAAPRVIVSPECFQSQHTRSPNKSIGRTDSRKVSPNHKVNHPHPYQIITKDTLESDAEKVTQIGMIRRRIFSNVDLKTTNHERQAEKQQRAIHRTHNTSTLPQPQPHVLLHPNFLVNAKHPIYPHNMAQDKSHIEESHSHVTAVSLPQSVPSEEKLENRLKVIQQHYQHRTQSNLDSQRPRPTQSSPKRRIPVVTDSDEENRPPKRTSIE